MHMRGKSRGLNDRLKTGMTIIGIVLLFFLFGKMTMLVPWQETGAVSLDMIKQGLSSWTLTIWESSHPADYANMGAEAAGEELPWYIEKIWDSSPLYHYGKSLKSAGGGYEESDPSYNKYIAKQEFYQEHNYLFQYGAENTDQQVVDAPAETPKPSETLAAGEADNTISASIETTTPAHITGVAREVVGKQYVLEQLADYDFLMKHFYNVHPSTTAGRDLMNANKFLSENFALTAANDKPQILIYHTHSQETFADYGTEHPDGTVVGIGDYLTSLLEERGYNVIHDTTVYDLHGENLDRNKAYTYALEGITSILQQNPSIEVVLDVHRDGVNESLHLVNEVNGKQTAPIMFFNGTSQTPTGPIEYLQNPYREDNLAFSLQMQLNAEAYFPGLTRKIYLKGLRYNLHLRPRSALIEVGAQTNTTSEAMNAMEPLAELLDMILQGK